MPVITRGYYCPHCGRHSYLEYEVPKFGKKQLPLLLLCCGQRMVTTANKSEKRMTYTRGRKVK